MSVSQNKFRLTGAKPISVFFPNDPSGEKVNYQVPDFQRNYAWDKDKVSQLWQDIMETWNVYRKATQTNYEGQYLLGSTVLIPDPDDVNITLIIDGQQRLATLTMIFCIIRDFNIELFEEDLKKDFTSHEFKELRTAIGNYNINKSAKPPEQNYLQKTSWKLKLNDIDKKLFEEIQKYFDGTKFISHEEKEKNIKVVAPKKTETKSQSKIKKAYNFLYETIRDGLITDFDDSTTSKEQQENFKKKAQIQAENEIKKEPKKFGLEEVFFENIKCWEDRTFGSALGWDDVLKDWTRLSKDEEFQKLNEQMEQRNKDKIKKTKEKEFKNFNEFMDWKIKNYKIGQKNAGSINGVNYNNKKKERTDEIVDEITKKERLKNIYTLNSILLHIRKNIFLVTVSGIDKSHNPPEKLLDENDAFQIFETLNDRGARLSKSNLVKNLVLSSIKKNNFSLGQKDENELKDFLDDMNDQWEEIFNENIFEQDDDSFLIESLRSRYPYDDQVLDESGNKSKVNKNALFKILKTKITDSDLAEEYLNELKEDSEFCKLLNSPGDVSTPGSYPDGDERTAILGLHALGAKYIRIPILTAKRKWIPMFPDTSIGNNPNVKKYRDLVKFLVPFFFRYKTIRDQPPQKLEGFIIALCQEIDKNENVNDMIKYLLQYDDEVDFHHNLNSGLKDIDSDVAKYMLYSFDRKLTSSYTDTEPIKHLTLEHILPQDQKQYWSKDKFFRDYEEKSKPPIFPKNFSKFVNNIGNLTILRGDINSKIKNKSYIVKRNHIDCKGGCKASCTCGAKKEPDGYLSSNLEINKQTVLKEYGSNTSLIDWTALIIEKREEEFIELSKEIWRLPYIRCSNLNCLGHQDKIALETISETCSGTFDNVKSMKCVIKNTAGIDCGSELELQFPNNW